MQHAYELIRSSRKTLSLEVTRDLRVRVRAPARMATRDIDAFVARQAAWIEAHLARQRARGLPPAPNEADIARWHALARAVIPARVAHYAALMGLRPSAVKITAAKTRYGSCSGKNSLCFSLYLMRFPKEAVDYVVVHELAHIAHKNHGQAFYALIEGILPDFRSRRALLKIE